jgi:bidirectional [NiFe] hydrogenase diaphorase subunit
MSADPNPTAPSTDKRWRLVDAAMRRHGYRADALIEALHVVQSAFGFLDKTALRQVAKALRVPPSQAFGVATFYHLFTLRPPGRHTCIVCMGTACYIKGAPALVDAAEKSLGVRLGETTSDGEVALMPAHCFGSCGVAPAAVFDGQVAGLLTAADVVGRLRRWSEPHDA